MLKLGKRARKKVMEREGKRELQFIVYSRERERVER